MFLRIEQPLKLKLSSFIRYRSQFVQICVKGSLSCYTNAWNRFDVVLSIIIIHFWVRKPSFAWKLKIQVDSATFRLLLCIFQWFAALATVCVMYIREWKIPWKRLLSIEKVVYLYTSGFGSWINRKHMKSNKCLFVWRTVISRLNEMKPIWAK